jgi:hypothetical protein
VVHVLDGVSPADNLRVQSLVISRSQAMFGTYGGLSYLGALYGVPTLALYSDSEHLLPAHHDLARRAAIAAGGSLTLLNTGATGLLACLTDTDAARRAGSAS